MEIEIKVAESSSNFLLREKLESEFILVFLTEMYRSQVWLDFQVL